MTIDLYYSNFTNVGQQLEDLYDTYLISEQQNTGQSKLNPPNGENLTESETVGTNSVRSISDISTELSKKGSGLQRPVSINKQEFVNRPLKASERLKFVRDQCKAMEKADVSNNPVESSEQSVNGKRNSDKPKNTSKTTPRKIALLATPVLHPDDSDWLAEDNALKTQPQQTSAPVEASAMWIPSPENVRNHGNGSPNKYSKSVSPSRGDGDQYFEQNSSRNRGKNDSSYSKSDKHSSLGHSHEKHLEDVQSKQMIGRGRGRRATNSRGGDQHGNHRDALYSLHFPGKANQNMDGRKAFEQNGPKTSHGGAANATQSDEESDVWNKGLETDGIYHHSPVAVKYAEEFLEFLDN